MRKRIGLILAVCLLLLPYAVMGNSAEPPSFLIIVPWADDNLTVTVEDSKNNRILGERHEKFSESYYLFYIGGGPGSEDFELLVKNEGVENRIPLPRVQSYNNLYTLDTDTLTLSPGKMPFRTVLFTTIRVVLTLLIEGGILYLFGYRKKSTYAFFIVMNLVTQMVLAWYLYRQILDLNYLFTLGLLIVEIMILAVEALLFSLFVKEHRIARGLIFVLVANILSFSVGFMLLRHLPF